MHLQPLAAFVAIFLDFALGGIAMDDDPLALVLVNYLILNHWVECAEEFVMSDKKMRLAAQVVEHACHFYGDVAGAYQRDLFGSFFEVEETVRRYAEFATWDALRNVGMAACGKENLLGSNCLFAAIVKNHFRFIFIQKMCAAMYPFNLIIPKVLVVYSVKTLDISVTLVLERRPVERCGLFYGEAICFCFVKSLSDGGCVPCDFLGNTSASYQLSSSSSFESMIYATHPTLTHVPPSRLLSIAIVFAPHCPLALRAEAKPPLPPPMTR